MEGNNNTHKSAPEPKTLVDPSKTLTDGPAAGAEHRCPVSVPDHELLDCIGRGSYGEVWLARNVMGTYRAVKIVYRATFEHARPFEREFNGIQKFEPISRSHDGFVDVLQIGRTPEYFYYVMELADDVVTSQQIDPATYEPKTLRSQVQGRVALPFEQCVELGFSLTAALSHLHGHGLIHRDIKPSNIIFVNGIPKLADIGLVADQSEAKSFVGTEGFIPPEGPGTPQADIYSLGKVLYEMATGKDRHEFPALPTLLGEGTTGTHALEMNAVVLKACQGDLKARYRTAEEMRSDLLLLQSGRSVKRTQAIERRLALLTRASVIGIVLTAITATGFYVTARQAKKEAALRARAEAGEYSADMALAYAALEIGHFGRSRELLAKHRRYVESQPGQDGAGADFWEWRYLWSQLQGDDLFILGRHEPIAQEAVFCPDGFHAVSSGKDGVVKYWDIERREAIKTMVLSNRTEIALSPDGTRLAAGTGNGQVFLWALPSFQQLWQITMDDSSAGRLRFAPDGRLLAVGGGQFISIVSVADGHLQQRVRTQRSQGYSFKVGLAFSPDSKWMAFSRHAGDIMLLEISSGEVHALGDSGGEYALTMAFSADGTTLASGEIALRIWDVKSRSLIKRLDNHRSHIVALNFSPDGTLLATASSDQTIKLWSSSTWEEKATLRGHEFELWSIAFSPDGKRLISASKDDTVRIWPVKLTSHEPPVPIHPLDAHVASFATSPTLVLFPHAGRELKAIELFSGKELLRKERPAGLEVAGCPLTLLPELVLGVVGVDGHIHLWDLKSGTQRWSARHHGAAVTALDSSAARQELAVLYADGTIHLLSVSDGKIKKRFHSERAIRRGIEKLPAHLSYSLTGNRLLAAADRVRQVPVWDLNREVEHLVPVAHREGIVSATLSADGHWLCTSSYDAYAIVSDVDSGRELTRCSGQFIGFRQGGFSSDKTRLALAARDGSLSIWNMSGQRLASFEADDELWGVAWEPRGDRILTAGGNGLRIWRAPTLDEIRAKASPLAMASGKAGRRWVPGR